MRVLAYNQGAAGAGMQGAASLDASLQVGLGAQPGIELTFLSAPPSRLPQKLLARPWWPLSEIDLDWHTARWHAVEAVKARGAVLERIRSEGRPDALLVNSHVVAFRLDDVMAEVPTFLHVDVGIQAWNDMAIWRAKRRHSEWTLRPSLRAEASTLAAATRVLAWSQWAADQVKRIAPSARTTVWHPGLDTSLYAPAERRPAARPSVLFVGGRFEQKGGNRLLTALGPSLGREIDLHVVAPVRLEPRPGLTVHHLGRSDPVLLDLLQQSTVLALPTSGDSVPWALLEAMACGTPVVASTVGAIPEMLEDGRSGVLCPADDVSLLRERILDLIGDPVGRKALGERGRARVVAHYDAVTNGARLAELLRGRAPAPGDDAHG